MAHRLAPQWISGLALIGLGAACGGGGGKAADKFVGAWQYSAGQFAINCPVLGKLDPYPLTGLGFELREGMKSDLSRVQLNCAADADVKGNVVSVRPGQTCQAPLNVMNMMLNVKLEFSSWTFTLDGQTGTTMGQGTASATSNGLTLNCTITETGTVMRSTADAGR